MHIYFVWWDLVWTRGTFICSNNWGWGSSIGFPDELWEDKVLLLGYCRTREVWWTQRWLLVSYLFPPLWFFYTSLFVIVVFRSSWGILGNEPVGIKIISQIRLLSPITGRSLLPVLSWFYKSFCPFFDAVMLRILIDHGFAKYGRLRF